MSSGLLAFLGYFPLDRHFPNLHTRLMAEWFYAKDGKQMGPVEESILRNLLSKGEITPASLVWRQGMPQWSPISQIPELASPPTGSIAQLQQTQPGPMNTSQSAATPQTPPAALNLTALWAFILAILSYLGCCCFTSLPGLVLALISRGQFKRNPAAYSNEWMWLVSFILCVINLVATLLILIPVIVTYIFAQISSTLPLAE